VRGAVDEGAVPLVLAGGCMSALGTVAALGPEGLGVVWLDAHADFDTPDDNVSGFFDVMALSILTGTGWAALRATIPGFAPVPEEDVVLAGVRDLEPYQRARLGRSAVRTVPGAFDADALAPALAALRERVERVYLHVDLDVLDSRAGRANEYAAPGGPGPTEVVGAVDAVFDTFEVAGAALTAYDPSEDTNGRARDVARRVIGRILERAR
jgi:arginase